MGGETFHTLGVRFYLIGRLDECDLFEENRDGVVAVGRLNVDHDVKLLIAEGYPVISRSG